ncbi:hypothetical protein BDV23DRAFT_152116 [Aspergillus alliaceus]|uniref:Uncharacterized protein n=1 Tax=Petromyces alliaceus TaxID=209559 RepID=A0A5N7CEW6_PETAA|nr:hypothetical protein BDV23DRAFT_152116 [Aspergillus alliaceus]
MRTSPLDKLMSGLAQSRDMHLNEKSSHIPSLSCRTNHLELKPTINRHSCMNPA